jgi:hypothetical protein
MRGKYYLWKDDSLMHIWARDGYDYWDESSWHQDNKQESSDIQSSGVALPHEVIDEFVVMRFAQLIETGRLTPAITRARKKWQKNVGCDALTRIADHLTRIESNYR